MFYLNRITTITFFLFGPNSTSGSGIRILLLSLNCSLISEAIFLCLSLDRNTSAMDGSDILYSHVLIIVLFLPNVRLPT